ncbi:MAG TPA: TonB-dependent receptor plug domain-containing protein [Micropepsaceae bacterium]|nr:TonB-dependent receptor plug domain-containing protein [Micropepsaceae bacterium]
MNSTATRFATLMGSASFLTLTTAFGVHAQDVAQVQMVQAAPETVPEQVLITGSLIHGTAAVGVPVTNLGVQDFTQTGNISIGDLFRTVPVANVGNGATGTQSGGHQERETRVNIRGLDGTGPRSLLMIDGVRFPPQADGLCSIDPSVIPALALDRVDILADGASATYGSDAVAGVINVVLKRGFDGAVTLLHAQGLTDSFPGGSQYQASQLYGRTWDGGDITLTYEWTDDEPLKNRVHSKYTFDFTPWGLDNEIPLGSSLPGTITVGKPKDTNGMGVRNVGTVCSNCFAVPAGAGANFNPAINNGVGPLLPGSAPGVLNFATLTPGVNEVDPMLLGWELGAIQKNSAVVTFDQRLFPGVSLFATGFYTDRRIEQLEQPTGPFVNPDIKGPFAVPTTNPYYPIGAPPNLQVEYVFSKEIPPYIGAYELSDRYQFGLNLDLPFGWTGQIYDSRSYEANQYVGHASNNPAVNVALGNTDPTTGATKPASIPYLNLFCDPRAFQCNSPATLAYISGVRSVGDKYSIEEKGARFDGPLFDLPAGQVKAAIGGTYETDNVTAFNAIDLNTPQPVGNTGPAPVVPIFDYEPFTVWAGFVQADIPIFGDNFNLPLARRLDFEVSWRHDQYSSPNGALAGGTSNPKLAFTWLIDELVGATVRGSWGTSFRFANAGEYSTVLSIQNTPYNLPGASVQAVPCTGGTPAAGSFAADLVAAGFACGSQPGGILWAGGPHPELRSFVNGQGQNQTREGGSSLAPETAANYSLGFELAPQFAVLRGFDLQATWYRVKINGTLNSFTSATSDIMSSSLQRSLFILPSDVGCPIAANANPATCAPFEKMVTAAILAPGSTTDPSQAGLVNWLMDGSTTNQGSLATSGIDFNASYDIDLGDLGAWNAGITGTYYLLFDEQAVNGGPIINDIKNPELATTPLNDFPRMRYRARLGWSDGAYSVTGFLNYHSHFFQPWNQPPNVNFQCTSAGGTIGGGTLPCAISNFNNFEPSWYTVDLSFGYNTGDMPASDYLKRITLQLTIQNLMGVHPAFSYILAGGGRAAAAYNILDPDTGRVIGITIEKTW